MYRLAILFLLMFCKAIPAYSESKFCGHFASDLAKVTTDKIGSDIELKVNFPIAYKGSRYSNASFQYGVPTELSTDLITWDLEDNFGTVLLDISENSKPIKVCASYFQGACLYKMCINHANK